jgi:hypothetical protein
MKNDNWSAKVQIEDVHEASNSLSGPETVQKSTLESMEDSIMLNNAYVSPKLHILLTVVQIFSVLIQTLNIASNLAYYGVASFADQTIFDLYMIFIVVRPILIAVFTIYFLISTVKRVVM